MSDKQRAHKDYSMLVGSLEKEIKIIKTHFFKATKKHFGEIFNKEKTNITESEFEAFCDHISYMLTMYYMNTNIEQDNMGSQIALQYEVKKIAQEIENIDISAYYDEFFVHAVIHNEKIMYKLTEMSAQAVNVEL